MITKAAIIMQDLDSIFIVFCCAASLIGLLIGFGCPQLAENRITPFQDWHLH